MASEDSINRRNAIAAAAALAKKNAAIDAANKRKGLAKTGERDAADTAAKAAADKAIADKVIADKAVADKAVADKVKTDEEAAAAVAATEAARIAALKANPPGKAWLWDDTAKSWIKPAQPTDGKKYTFNNDTGWTADVETAIVPDVPGDVVIDTITDSETGDIYRVWQSGKKTLLSKGTKIADAAAAAATIKYDKEQAAIAKQAKEEAEKKDAFATIQDTMRSYGFTDSEMSELSGFIEKSIIDPNVGPNMALLNMRNLGVYKSRFSANQTLINAGKNALSEYDYLQQENAYDEYFKAYGVSNLSTRAQKATLIGNSVSALEVDKRLNLAVRRVKGSDPEILKQLKTYFPSITDKDLVSYFLNPETTRVDLERKVTASEISSAAVGQGFNSGTSLSALGLADYGIDRSSALKGYAQIAEVLPEATKLGNIYGETKIKYTQQTGEEEYLQNSDAAKRKRNILESKERASFGGSAGAAPGAYSTGYLKKSSSAGQY